MTSAKLNRGMGLPGTLFLLLLAGSPGCDRSNQSKAPPKETPAFGSDDARDASPAPHAAAAGPRRHPRAAPT